MEPSQSVVSKDQERGYENPWVPDHRCRRTSGRSPTTTPLSPVTAAPPRFSGDGDAKRPLMPTLLRHPQPPSNLSDLSSSLGGFFLRRCVGDGG
ncbi:hypothetical protein Hanom_Chr11g00999941 [Helianthus anomalus]